MKKKLLALLLLFAAVLPLSTGCSAGAAGIAHGTDDYILTYDVGDKTSFRILQLTDIHVANKDDRGRQFDFLTTTVEAANADMIVVTGDLFTFADKTTALELFDFLDGFGLPWTVTFGNHDEQCYFPVDWMTGVLNDYGKNCLFRDLTDDDVYGNANFAINLEKDGSLFWQIILMDSNRYHFGDYIGYDYIKPDQIAWYRRVVEDTAAKQGGEVADSLLFFHIPLPEWQTAYEDYLAGGETEYISGVRGENSSPAKYNSGLFDAVLDLGSTRAISVGHDHLNDMILRYQGVYLCYGVNSTDRIYYDEGLLGGRVLEIGKDGALSFENVFGTYE